MELRKPVNTLLGECLTCTAMERVEYPVKLTQWTPKILPGDDFQWKSSMDWKASALFSFAGIFTENQFFHKRNSWWTFSSLWWNFMPTFLVTQETSTLINTYSSLIAENVGNAGQHRLWSVLNLFKPIPLCITMQDSDGNHMNWFWSFLKRFRCFQRLEFGGFTTDISSWLF